jgi:hypothetical protein
MLRRRESVLIIASEPRCAASIIAGVVAVGVAGPHRPVGENGSLPYAVT